MKKILSVIFLSIVSLCAFAQEGTWKGDLKVQGMTLPLVFHLSAQGCTLDSPAQGVNGLPVERQQQDGGSIVLAIPSIGAKYEGKYDGKEITGQFTQNGFALPLTLTPGEVTVNRPQTPVAPFPYKEEQVSFANGGFTFNGTLVLPEQCTKKTPVVLMVTGSGQQNRDEELFGHKPFAVIADALARKGIASLRYDDRGWGDNTVDFQKFTVNDFKQDAQSGIDFLKKRFAKVGVLGHSEGGTIALMLAAEGKVDFAVSLAGMAISGMKTLVMQNRTGISQLGLPAETVESYCKAVESALKQMGEGKALKDIDFSDAPQQLKPAIVKALQQCETPYLRDFVKIDVSSSLPSVKCPVMALNGTKDIQVDATENLKTLEKGLTSSKHMVKSYDNLNHMFQHCTIGSVIEYQQIEETISPEVLTDITTWINDISK